MNKPSRTALVAAAILVLGAGTADAATTTVGQRDNGLRAAVTKGDSLRITLSPADSGSTGFHWRVARKPARSVLRLASDRATSDGSQQVFTYRARGAGATRLRLQYVPPGRRRRAVKSFDLTVLVSPPELSLDCNASGFRSTTVAQSGQARVFRVRRTQTILVGLEPVPVSYDAYYGCALSQDRAFRLPAPTGEELAPTSYSNLALRGAAVGFVYHEFCPFNGDGCERPAPLVVSMDLHTGKLIRVVVVGASGPGEDNEVTGLVLSATGGLAWIEQAGGQEPANLVLRSDGPVGADGPGTDPEFLDNGSQGLVDPDSLTYDGSQIGWVRAGARQQATLK